MSWASLIVLHKFTFHCVIENVMVISSNIRYTVSDIQGDIATPAHSSVRTFNIIAVYIVQGITATSKPGFPESHNCKLSAKITHEYFKRWQFFYAFEIKMNHENHFEGNDILLHNSLNAYYMCNVPTTPLVFEPGLRAHSESRASALTNSAKGSDPLARS